MHYVLFPQFLHALSYNNNINCQLKYKDINQIEPLFLHLLIERLCMHSYCIDAVLVYLQSKYYVDRWWASKVCKTLYRGNKLRIGDICLDVWTHQGWWKLGAKGNSPLPPPPQIYCLGGQDWGGGGGKRLCWLSIELHWETSVNMRNFHEI